MCGLFSAFRRSDKRRGGSVARCAIAYSGRIGRAMPRNQGSLADATLIDQAVLKGSSSRSAALDLSLPSKRNARITAGWIRGPAWPMAPGQALTGLIEASPSSRHWLRCGLPPGAGPPRLAHPRFGRGNNLGHLDTAIARHALIASSESDLPTGIRQAGPPMRDGRPWRYLVRRPNARAPSPNGRAADQDHQVPRRRQLRLRPCHRSTR